MEYSKQNLRRRDSPLNKDAHLKKLKRLAECVQPISIQRFKKKMKTHRRSLLVSEGKVTRWLKGKGGSGM